MTGSLPPSQEIINEFVIAAHHDLNKVQQMLPEHPLLLNENAEWIETPIQAAAHVGNRPIAEYLLAQGAPLDICTAAMLGRRDDVESMLRTDRELAYARGAHGIPVLYYPAISGDVGIATMLLEAGADIKAGEGSNTPLHGAAFFDQYEMAIWLLDHGANVNANDFNGKTPLTIAQERGNERIAAALRERDAAE